MRKKLIVANWKMNLNVMESFKYFTGLRRHLYGDPECEVVFCPPFTSLYAIEEALEGSLYKLGAQNMHWEEAGAFTGEISPLFLRELSVRYVILGHSERRQTFGETDIIVNKKLTAALQWGLTPIVCVGESAQEQKEGKTFEVVESQIKKALDGQLKTNLSHIVWAYEPIWAIGTGKNATPEQAQEVLNWIRRLLAKVLDAPTADGMRILYGGSVSEEKAKLFLKQGDVDGLLVGGASIDPEKFAAIIRATSMPQ